MDHLDRAALRCAPYALFEILRDFTCFQLALQSIFCRDTAPAVIGILFEELGTGSPALCTAYTAIAIYCYLHSDVYI